MYVCLNSSNIEGNAGRSPIGDRYIHRISSLFTR